MNNLNTNQPYGSQDNSAITDVSGAMKILNVTRMTLYRWEKDGFLKGFKGIHSGRLKKCFYVDVLEKIVSRSQSVEEK